MYFILFSNNCKVSYSSKPGNVFGHQRVIKKDLLKFNVSVRKRYKAPYVHNLIQIIANSNKRLRFLKYIDLFQWYISLYNRLCK